MSVEEEEDEFENIEGTKESILDEDGDESSNTQISTIVPSESPSTSDQFRKRPHAPSKISRSSKQSKSQMDFINYCKSQLERDDSLDEFDATAIAWAKKMKRMNPTPNPIYADMLVNKIINQGLLNQLTQNTAVIEQISTSATPFSPLSPHSSAQQGPQLQSDSTCFYQEAGSSYQKL